jgi:hypothetical protein
MKKEGSALPSLASDWAMDLPTFAAVTSPAPLMHVNSTAPLAFSISSSCKKIAMQHTLLAGQCPEEP